MKNTYFFTGFPGFIAVRLIKRLMQENAQARFVLLVHPSQEERAKGEVERLVSHDPTWTDSFFLIKGDITEENLGIPEVQLADWKKRMTHLFHLAAVYDLAVPQELAYRVNVIGTKRVNEWAKELPNLQRYVYFSTAYVSGDRQGLIRESELSMNQGFKNHYEKTKYEAEVLVQAEMGRLPLTVIRPGIVMGDSNTGETAKFDGPYLLMQFLHRFRHLPIPYIGKSDTHINLVPVDYVVAATAYLAHAEAGMDKVYHLTDPEPQSVRHVYTQICRELVRKEPAWTIPLPLVSSALSVPAFRRWVKVQKETLDYFQCASRYDCSQAIADLQGSGITCPQFDDYVGAAVRYFQVHRNDSDKVIIVH